MCRPLNWLRYRSVLFSVLFTPVWTDRVRLRAMPQQKFFISSLPMRAPFRLPDCLGKKIWRRGDASPFQKGNRSEEDREKKKGKRKNFPLSGKNNCSTRSLRPLSVRSLCILYQHFRSKTASQEKEKLFCVNVTHFFSLYCNEPNHQASLPRPIPKKEPTTQHCQHTKFNKVIFRDACVSSCEAEE